MVKRLVLTLSFGCVMLSAAAVGKWDFKIDGIYYKIVSSTAKTVAVANSSANPDPTKYATESYSGDVVIPSTVTDSYGMTYSVVKINKYAFHTCSNLTSVKIPASVVEIDDEVFVGNTSLTSLDLPSSVSAVGNGNFTGCSLEWVEIWNKDIDMSFLATMPTQTELVVHSCCLKRLGEYFSGTSSSVLEAKYLRYGNSCTFSDSFEFCVYFYAQYIAVESIDGVYLLNEDGSQVEGVRRSESSLYFSFYGLVASDEYDFVAECNLPSGRMEEFYYTFTCNASWRESEVRKLSDTEAEIWLYTNSRKKVKGNGIKYWEAGTDDVKTLPVPINEGGYMGFVLTDLEPDKEYEYEAYYITDDGKYYSRDFTYKHTGDNNPSWRIVSDVLDVEVDGTTAKLIGYVITGTYDYNKVGFVLNYEEDDETFVEADSFCDGWAQATVTGLNPYTTYCVQVKVCMPEGYYDNISVAEVYFTTGGASAINDVKADEVNLNDECVVRTITGVIVAAGKTWAETKLQLSPGIYLLTIGNCTTKVAVK